MGWYLLANSKNKANTAKITTVGMVNMLNNSSGVEITSKTAKRRLKIISTLVKANLFPITSFSVLH